MINTWKVDKTLDRVVPIDTVAQPSLNAVSLNIPEGCYTTFRTYNGSQVLAFVQHIYRLIESASLSGITINIDISRLKGVLRDLLPNKENDWRIRITVDLVHEIGMLYVSMETFSPLPIELYQRGIEVITQPYIRKNPQAKVSGFIRQTDSLRKSTNGLMSEVLLVDDQGYLLEGLTSNFFAIIDGEIHTSSTGVLHGVTRGVILELIREANITLHNEPVSIADLQRINEAFISSASREVMPVRKIDHQVLSNQVPGTITASLMDLFKQHLINQLETL